jgi:hypothetical protein
VNAEEIGNDIYLTDVTVPDQLAIAHGLDYFAHRISQRLAFNMIPLVTDLFTKVALEDGKLFVLRFSMKASIESPYEEAVHELEARRRRAVALLGDGHLRGDELQPPRDPGAE